MTADVSGPSVPVRPARPRRGRRLVVVVLAVAAVLLGAVLLINPFAAVRALALLISACLVIGGCLDIAAGRGADGRAVTVVPGALLVIGGIVTAVWPDATLWALAAVSGLVLILHGCGRMALAFSERSTTPGWGWFALAGAVNVVVGGLALLWPAATVLVLSLAVGAQLVLFGVFLLVAALAGSREGGADVSRRDAVG